MNQHTPIEGFLRNGPIERREADAISPEVMKANIAAGVWLAFLVGVGCFVLNALAESERREECLMRGARACSTISSIAGQERNRRSSIGSRFAEHLKLSRRW